jgi:hypothetical protein
MNSTPASSRARRCHHANLSGTRSTFAISLCETELVSPSSQEMVTSLQEVPITVPRSVVELPQQTRSPTLRSLDCSPVILFRLTDRRGVIDCTPSRYYGVRLCFGLACLPFFGRHGPFPDPRFDALNDVEVNAFVDHRVSVSFCLHRSVFHSRTQSASYHRGR